VIIPPEACLVPFCKKRGGILRIKRNNEVYQKRRSIKSPKAGVKKVSVVGSGPAGLSAAYYLMKAGYSITVFDQMEEAGGLLTYGIPSYRLPKTVVKKQVKVFEDLGIKFQLRTTLGKDTTVDKLAQSFDAVFIACGAWKERAAGVKGED